MKFIEGLCKNPEFTAETNGIESNTKKQKRGIRQGCPLSPYLFVLVMTALLHDVHWQVGVDFGEVLYADGTILVGKTMKKYRTYYRKFRKSPKNMVFH